MSPIVDSAAMRLAARNYYQQNPAAFWEMCEDKLTEIQHCGSLPSLPVAEDMPITFVHCPGDGSWCTRCQNNLYGYTFRWFSILWMQDYEKLRRKGTWTPGDPENTFRSPISSFTGELLNSKGERVNCLLLSETTASPFF
jgi:hypothetical protein